MGLRVSIRRSGCWILLATISGCATGAATQTPVAPLPDCAPSVYFLQGVPLPDYVRLVRFDAAGYAVPLATAPVHRPCRAVYFKQQPLAGYPLPDYVVVTTLSNQPQDGVANAVE